jgi:hypothetical protein
MSTFPLSTHCAHLKNDVEGLSLLEELANEVPIKENRNASPSSWYTALIAGEYFFDGFGFDAYRKKFEWEEVSIDQNERLHKPIKPLLPFLEQLNRELPTKWDRQRKAFVTDHDWLLWDFKEQGPGGSVRDIHRGEGGEPPSSE